MPAGIPASLDKQFTPLNQINSFSSSNFGGSNSYQNGPYLNYPAYQNSNNYNSLGWGQTNLFNDTSNY
jgi:hypothetical protein